MVKLDEVRTLNHAVVQAQPLVAVFFGGNSGIGHYTLRAFAKATANGGQGLRAYVVGRNAKAAEDVMSECQGICPQGQFKFIKAEDLSLIRNVDQVCAEVIKLEEAEGQDARIDYLMMCQAGLIFLPRKDTAEGIDVTMSLMYYSRMRVILKLLPLLLKSTFPATVVSVYAAGTEAKLFPDDLSVRDLKRYSYSQARSHMCYMHTLFMETLAEQYRGKLSLIHIFPGIVLTPGFSNPELSAWFRTFWHWVVVPLLGPFVFVQPMESGDRMLSLASSRYPPRPTEGNSSNPEAIMGSDGKPGSGVYILTWNGENTLKPKSYEGMDREEMRKKVWDHTTKAFEVIEAGGVFDG